MHSQLTDVMSFRRLRPRGWRYLLWLILPYLLWAPLVTEELWRTRFSTLWSRLCVFENFAKPLLV